MASNRSAHRLSRRAALAAVFVVALAAPAAVLATGALDQSQEVFGGEFGLIGTWDGDGVSPVYHAQTFTSGSTGNLDQVDLPLRYIGDPGVPLKVEIRTTAGGLPTSTVLAMAGVSEFSIIPCLCSKSDFVTFGWVSIPFGSPASVVAGQQYAIVASAVGAAQTVDSYPTRTDFEWAGSGIDSYSGGTHFSKVGDWEDTGSDFAFRTYVTAPVSYSAAVGQPINTDGSSIFKAKQGVIPVKFTLSANGSPTCNLPAASIVVTKTSGADAGLVNESTYLLAADTGTAFRISDCQYVYNLSAKSLTAGRYRVDIQLGGNTVGTAAFELR